MKYYLPKVAFIILMILFFHLSGTTQNNYAWQRDLIGNYNFENRIVPELPGKNEKIRVIIDTDARNEIDDQWAITLALLSPVPFVLFDTGTYLTCSMGESENYVKPYGEIGNYLHEFRKTNSWFQKPDKGFFDLGDIAFLVDPEIGAWHITHCPEIDRDMSYRFTYRKGQILRCYHIDRNKTFQLLYDKLKERYGS